MIDEKEIWENFRRGDVLAFEKIYSLFARVLYNYGRNFTGDGAIVEDCLQDLFAELWSKRENIGDTTSIKFYLLSSMRRRLFRKLQQESKRNHYNQEIYRDNFLSSVSFESTIILNEEEKERQTLLLNAINALPARQREVMYLRYYQGLSFDEITTVMDLPKKTAYNVVFKALSSLRTKLQPSFVHMVLLLLSL